MVKKSSIGKIC